MPLAAIFLAEIGAERSVHRLVSVYRRAKCERHLLHLGDRYHVAENAAHEGKELDLTGDQHLEHGRIAAGELVVFGNYPRLDTPTRFVADGRPHADEALVKRARFNLVVVLREGELGLGRAG